MLWYTFMVPPTLGAERIAWAQEFENSLGNVVRLCLKEEKNINFLVFGVFFGFLVFLFFWFILFFGARNWAQGHMHAKQVLYLWATSPVLLNVLL